MMKESSTFSTIAVQPARLHTVLLAALSVAVLVALAVRVAPLVDGGDRLQRQCVSEDGYLMLTIARNIARGKGFSVMDGDVATNGTQPLGTLLYALCYKIVAGDRLRGLYPVVAVQVLISLLTAGVIYRATRGVFYTGPHNRTVAWLAAGFWFVSPTSVMHGQNSLETGLYVLLIVVVLAMYDRLIPRLDTGLRWGSCLVLGGVLGVVFLARMDACFLIAVLLAVHLWRAYRRRRLGRGFVQCWVMGLTSVIVASPWLWFNVSRFGHLMPVSGRSESFGIAFAHNLMPAFAAMMEDALVVVRLPGSWEASALVRIVAIGFLLACTGLAAYHRSWLANHFSAGVAVWSGFMAALFFYYALFFGMPGFLGRYFSPIVGLASLLAAALFVVAAGREDRPVWQRGMIVIAGVAAIACITLDARIYRQGKTHMHFQAVEWVRRHVPETTWVGAVQSGTLGYYHDRTVNLDGKVNPEALAYRRQGRIAEYVVQRDVEYIVDWASIAEWAGWPAFAANYELLLNDPDRGPRGLAVLRRRPAAAKAEDAAMVETP